jgi:hypothetical protein
VSQDVKDEIVNSVSAGKTVKISEQEIVQNTWQGVGYIIRDPETATGAYKISGGIAGGEMNYPLYGNIIFVLLTLNQHGALICWGDYYDSFEEEIARALDVYDSWWKLLALGYYPVYEKVFCKHDFIEQIQRENKVIFVYIGDGRIYNYAEHDTVGDPVLRVGGPPPGAVGPTTNPSYYVSANDISTNLPSGSQYIFVFLSGCWTAHHDHMLGGAFTATANIGNKKSGTAASACGWFFGFCNLWLTIEDAFQELVNFPGGPYEDFSLSGDGSFRLKRW